jgi:predicted MFS family arabinose efflux permease
MDIGLFTMRQRRTAPAWIGRAFAISMAVNAIGYPVGAAVAGVVAESSLATAIGLAAVSCLAAALLALRLVPRHDPDEVSAEPPTRLVVEGLPAHPVP